MKKQIIIEKTIQIQASPEKIWEALTNPEMTKQYMHHYKVLSDWQIKSDIVWKGSENNTVDAKGEIINIIPGKILEYTIHYVNPKEEKSDSETNRTIITYELIPEKDYTILSITQGDFARIINGENEYKKEKMKWDSALKLLKKLVENT